VKMTRPLPEQARNKPINSHQPSQRAASSANIGRMRRLPLIKALGLARRRDPAAPPPADWDGDGAPAANQGRPVKATNRQRAQARWISQTPASCDQPPTAASLPTLPLSPTGPMASSRLRTIIGVSGPPMARSGGTRPEVQCNQIGTGPPDSSPLPPGLARHLVVHQAVERPDLMVACQPVEAIRFQAAAFPNGRRV